MDLNNILSFKPNLDKKHIIYRRSEKNGFESIAFNSYINCRPFIFDSDDISIIELFDENKSILDILNLLNNKNGKTFNEILEKCIQLVILFKKIKIGNFEDIEWR